MSKQIKDLVKALRKVPEKTFRISELAPSLIDEDGTVDIDKALEQQPEINLAVVEIESYIKASRQLTKTLDDLNIYGKSGDEARVYQEMADDIGEEDFEDD